MSLLAEPLERREFDTHQLALEHPPVWRHANKRLVYDMISPPGSEHNGHITYSRWPPMELPENVDIGSAVENVIERNGFYDYAPIPTVGGIEWHVNFAAAELFVAYSSRLLAQDELQVLEHPALGSVREAITALGGYALTVDRAEPTPILLAGVERRCKLATESNADQGRPDGLYGNEFARASDDVIRRAIQRLEPPTSSNIIAMEAPTGGTGAYTSSTIRYILTTAYSGFRAAVRESRRLSGRDSVVVVHTGFWGCGAYGGNRTLMSALQMVASGLAGLDRLVFHTGESSGSGFLHDGQVLCKTKLDVAQPVSTSDVVSVLASLAFEWGMSNGT